MASSSTTNDKKPYLHGHHPSVLRSHTTRTAQNSCPHLLPHLHSRQQPLRLLDVGCGPGTITTSLAQLLPPGSTVTGLDYSPAVLASARAHAHSQGVTNVVFREGDVYALPFADGAFDVVHANQVVQHVADPVAAVREMRRVARADGGIVALREGDAQVWFPDDEGPGAVLREWYALWLRMAREGGMEPNMGRRLLSVALRAGCKREEVVAGVGSACWQDRGELEEWCGMWAERVVRSEFAEKAVGGGYATVEGLERLAGAWREFAARGDAWYGMLQGETIITRSG